MQTNKNYRIRREDVEAWLITANERTCRIIRWLDAYASERDISTEQIGSMLRKKNGKCYSGDSVYQALTGRRNERQLTLILDSIDAFAKIERERCTITRAGFVETDLTRKVFSVCDAARNFGKTMFVTGRSHTGKTTAFKEYARITNLVNRDSTCYFRAPAGGGKSRSLFRLCKARHLSTGGNDYHKEAELIDSFSPLDVLLVDEAHQFLSGKIGLRTLEFIRELSDESGCGVVYGATEVFEHALNEDPTVRKLLGQLKMRSLIHAKLPDRTTRSDLTKFAKHFGLAAAKGQALDLQTEIIRTDSLGRWLSIMEGASRIASKAKDQMTWDHVIQSHAALVTLESGI